MSYELLVCWFSDNEADHQKGSDVPLVRSVATLYCVQWSLMKYICFARRKCLCCNWSYIELVNSKWSQPSSMCVSSGAYAGYIVCCCDTNAEAVGYRTCDSSGEWLNNKTDYSHCFLVLPSHFDHVGNQSTLHAHQQIPNFGTFEQVCAMRNLCIADRHFY